MDLGILRSILILLLLLPPAYWDLKTREVEPKYWLLAGIIALSASMLSYGEIMEKGEKLLLVFVITSFLAIMIVGISYFMGLMGGADLFALAVITLGVPTSLSPSVLGVPFLTLLYASLVSMAFPVTFCLINVLLYRSYLKDRPRLLCFLGIPFKASRLASNPGFWYPLEIYDENGKREFRYTFNIEEEPNRIASTFKKLINRGILDRDSIIYVTPGIPFIVFIVIGYIISILLGDTPIQAIMGEI